MRRLLPAVISLFLSSFAFAETTYTFLVIKEKLDPATYKNSGLDSSRQPSLITKVLDAPNTNYALVQFTPTTAMQKNDVFIQDSLGNAILLTEDTITTEMERGDLVTRRQVIEHNPKPDDAFLNWAVIQSSGGK